MVVDVTLPAAEPVIVPVADPVLLKELSLLAGTTPVADVDTADPVAVEPEMPALEPTLVDVPCAVTCALAADDVAEAETDAGAIEEPDGMDEEPETTEEPALAVADGRTLIVEDCPALIADDEPVGTEEVPDAIDATPVPTLDLTEVVVVPAVSCDRMLDNSAAGATDVVVPMRDVCELGVPMVAPARIEDMADDTLGTIPEVLEGLVISAGADVVVPTRDVCKLDVPIVTPASIEDIADDTLGMTP